VDFEERLKSAIERGQRRAQADDAAKQKQHMSEQDVKSKHTDFRLRISDHVEEGLKKLTEHFPGFTYETIYGDRGWGGAIYRDDLTSEKGTGKVGSFYSRLEMTVRPISDYGLVDVSVRGTVFNKEVLATNFFEEVQFAVLDNFIERIDAWMVTYAEMFAAK